MTLWCTDILATNTLYYKLYRYKYLTNFGFFSTKIKNIKHIFLITYLLETIIIFTFYTSIFNFIVRKYNIKSRYTFTRHYNNLKLYFIDF